MPETGLIVVHDEPIESVYTLAPNGLFLPPHVTPVPAGFLANNPYPEFAAELVKELDKIKFGSHPTPGDWILKYYAKPKKPKPPNLTDLVPSLNMPMVLNCPARCGEQNGCVSNTIVHLNDDHKWSRERIANWLDTLEGVDLRVKKVAANG